MLLTTIKVVKKPSLSLGETQMIIADINYISEVSDEVVGGQSITANAFSRAFTGFSLFGGSTAVSANTISDNTLGVSGDVLGDLLGGTTNGTTPTP
ncbi:hypothetical protein IQ238_24310 [Pleurocapsales cyanobacterium LEGE 06147]|nr:hypothetical protein [Pleurocapsales cyanobacterium LEGE 06147]